MVEEVRCHKARDNVTRLHRDEAPWHRGTQNVLVCPPHPNAMQIWGTGLKLISRPAAFSTRSIAFC
jgi:hypothetical protein